MSSSPARALALLLVAAMAPAGCGDEPRPGRAPADAAAAAGDAGAFADRDAAAGAATCWGSPATTPWRRVPDDVPPPLWAGTSFSAAPDTVYLVAGEPRGLYRSRDGGRSFCPLAIPAATVEALYAASAHPQVLYLLTSDERRMVDAPPGPVRIPTFELLRSIDGGESWSRLAQDGLPRADFGWHLVVHPRKPSVLLARRRHETRVGPGQLLRSDDGGVSWQPVADALAATLSATDPGAAVAFGLPAFDTEGTRIYMNVFVRWGNNLVARSDDDGRTWQTLASPVPGSSMFSPPGERDEMLVDPAGAIYLVAPGFHRSRDGAASWSVIDEPLHVVALDGDVAGRLYGYRAPSEERSARLARTSDGGDSWLETPVALSAWEGADPTPFLFGAVGGTRVYLGDAGALARSSDGGASLETMKELLPGTRVAVWPGRPDLVLVGKGERASLSGDGGRTWSRLPLPAGAGADSLAGNGDAPDTVFAIANDGLFDGPAHRSADGGRTWQPLGSKSLRSLVVPPGQRGRVLAASVTEILRSDDGGETWRVVRGDCLFPTLAMAPSQPSTLYAACLQQIPPLLPVVLASEDGGATWATRGQHPIGRYAFEDLRLAIDPTNPAALVAAGDGGLWRSEDGGRTWTQGHEVNAAERIGALLVHPADGRVVYALRGGRAIKSSDRGASWRGLGAEARSLAVDPRNPDLVYLGTKGGLLVSHSGGEPKLSSPGP